MSFRGHEQLDRWLGCDRSLCRCLTLSAQTRGTQRAPLCLASAAPPALSAPYASTTSTEPTETLPKASPDTAPPPSARAGTTHAGQIGSMEGVPGLTERSRGHATRTWVSLDRRADVEEVATAPCAPLDARSLRLAPAGGSGSGMEIRARGGGIDQRGR